MAGTAPRALGLGTAIVVLTALVCLAFAAARDPATVSSLQELARDSVLMSCADAGSSSDGLLWCADPSSPHCIPAAPEAPRLELWSSPELCVLPSAVAPAPTYVTMTWPAPHVAPLHGRLRAERLERPPRA